MIAYATQPILAFKAGDLITTDEPGKVAVLLSGGTEVLSVQPDGRYEARPRHAIGPWEKARKAGDKLVFSDSAYGDRVYVVPIVEGI